MCRPCYLEASRRQYKLRIGRIERAHADDIPAAEIERRFALALSQIRRRAWTLPTSPS
jgi:hypothetical protein